VVVLPTPPFWLATAKTFAKCTSTVELFHVEHRDSVSRGTIPDDEPLIKPSR